MSLNRLALIVLFFFAIGLAPAAADEALHLASHADEASPFEYANAPCPDSEDGHPCGPACPCACCPGHRTIAAFVTVSPAFQELPSPERFASPAERLHPQDVFFSFFHPPRA
jgi:hypothetical protein